MLSFLRMLHTVRTEILKLTAKNWGAASGAALVNDLPSTSKAWVQCLIQLKEGKERGREGRRGERGGAERGGKKKERAGWFSLKASLGTNIIPSTSQKLSEESSCLVHWRTAFWVSSLQIRKIALFLFPVSCDEEKQNTWRSNHLRDSSTAPSRSACSHSSMRLASSEYWTGQRQTDWPHFKTAALLLFLRQGHILLNFPAFFNLSNAGLQTWATRP